MKIIYQKLVRDKIPEIIEASGKTCRCSTLSHPEYLDALDRKLSEELAEYQQDKSMEELADLMEVIRAVIAARGSTYEEVDAIRMAKREKRGGFDKCIWLIETDDGTDEKQPSHI